MSGLLPEDAGAPRAEDGSTGGSRLVASGAVRPPDEVDALSVDLAIDDFEITMSAGRAEIGSWLTSTVTIRRIGDPSVESLAAGDRLIFLPEDPATFGDHPAVGEAEDGKRRRRREKGEGKAAKKSARRAGKAAKAAKVAKKKEARGEMRSSRRASSEERRGDRWMGDETEPSDVEPSDPALEDRMAAIMAMDTRDLPDRESGSDQTAAVEAHEQSQAVTEPAAEDRGRVKWRGRPAVEEPETVEEPESDGGIGGASEESEDDPNQLWIRALDVARRYDLFGLDRVPIDESLRGQKHEHTWDHRVAAASGAGAHICLICGKIRR